MSQRRRTPKQIINKLRQAEVELAQVRKRIGVADRTYYHRWETSVEPIAT